MLRFCPATVTATLHSPPTLSPPTPHNYHGHNHHNHCIIMRTDCAPSIIDIDATLLLCRRSPTAVAGFAVPALTIPPPPSSLSLSLLSSSNRSATNRGSSHGRRRCGGVYGGGVTAAELARHRSMVVKRTPRDGRATPSAAPTTTPGTAATASGFTTVAKPSVPSRDTVHPGSTEAMENPAPHALVETASAAGPSTSTVADVAALRAKVREAAAVVRERLANLRHEAASCKASVTTALVEHQSALQHVAAVLAATPRNRIRLAGGRAPNTAQVRAAACYVCRRPFQWRFRVAEHSERVPMVCRFYARRGATAAAACAPSTCARQWLMSREASSQSGATGRSLSAKTRRQAPRSCRS